MYASVYACMHVCGHRAGITPFLAAHLQGYDNFKWMLYGDDDTVFFIDNALDMLAGLDHDMPYFLSDHLWFQDQLGEDCPASLASNTYKQHGIGSSVNAPQVSVLHCVCSC